MRQLAQLQAALDARGVRCVLARHHRLVLRYNCRPSEPSGLTDPQLHIFVPSGTEIATTDITSYQLASGRVFSASDPSAAAAVIASGLDYRGVIDGGRGT
jgi:hypothetical protein